MAVITPFAAVVGRAEGIRETVTLDAAVVKRVCKYRQVSPFAAEAGGQLFGTVVDGRVAIRVATGPYCGDERARYYYRSHPMSAQRAMRRQAKAGFYLPRRMAHASRERTSSIR